MAHFKPWSVWCDFHNLPLHHHCSPDSVRVSTISYIYHSDQIVQAWRLQFLVVLLDVEVGFLPWLHRLIVTKATHWWSASLCAHDGLVVKYLGPNHHCSHPLASVLTIHSSVVPPLFQVSYRKLVPSWMLSGVTMLLPMFILQPKVAAGTKAYGCDRNHKAHVFHFTMPQNSNKIHIKFVIQYVYNKI